MSRRTRQEFPPRRARSNAYVGMRVDGQTSGNCSTLRARASDAPQFSTSGKLSRAARPSVRPPLKSFSSAPQNALTIVQEERQRAPPLSLGISTHSRRPLSLSSGRAALMLLPLNRITGRESERESRVYVNQAGIREKGLLSRAFR